MSKTQNLILRLLADGREANDMGNIETTIWMPTTLYEKSWLYPSFFIYVFLIHFVVIELLHAIVS